MRQTIQENEIRQKYAGLSFDELAVTANLFLEGKNPQESDTTQVPTSRITREEEDLALPVIGHETLDMLKDKTRRKGQVTLNITGYFPDI